MYIFLAFILNKEKHFCNREKIYLYLQLTTINLRMMCTDMMNLFLSMKTGEAKIESQYELFVGLLF